MERKSRVYVRNTNGKPLRIETASGKILKAATKRFKQTGRLQSRLTTCLSRARQQTACYSLG